MCARGIYLALFSVTLLPNFVRAEIPPCLKQVVEDHSDNDIEVCRNKIVSELSKIRDYFAYETVSVPTVIDGRDGFISSTPLDPATQNDQKMKAITFFIAVPGHDLFSQRICQLLITQAFKIAADEEAKTLSGIFNCDSD
jgi:hypothetical protein